jgi:hypothetical protein
MTAPWYYATAAEAVDVAFVPAAKIPGTLGAVVHIGLQARMKDSFRFSVFCFR